MPTRVVHRVRCRKKDDKQVWADVKVVDGVTVVAPNGQEMMLWVRAKDAIPFIVDKTGAQPSNEKGELRSCTRASHMEIVKSDEDDQQKFYIECLDACAFKPPTHFNADGSGFGQQENEQKRGLPEAATFGKGPFALLVPEKDANKFVVDKTGLGLDSGSANGASRCGHISLVTEKGNTDDKTDGIAEAGDTIPPQKLAWCAVLKLDAISFKVPNGNIAILIPKGKQDEVDTTQMTTDPVTGDPCPPDNNDPNVYVSFPRTDTKDPNGPVVGASVKIPIRATLGKKPIDQGPLWWIERISPVFKPWFYFADINVPMAFSYFGSPGRLGSWAWRGFVLWNNYPVIWILSQNNAIVPMGTFGSPSLDLCARIGDWDFSFPPVPSAPFLAPGKPDGSNVQLPFSGEAFAGSISNEGFANEPGPFGPFGILQFTHPPLGPGPDKVPYGIVGDGSALSDGRPNIFQLTGDKQPDRIDVHKPWEPFSNPYPPPSAKDAKDIAMKFKQNWNAVANGHNEFIAGYVGEGGVSNGGASYSQPPGWNWAIPWFDGSIGPPTDYRASFQNGIPPGVATRALPLEVYTPATAWTLDVDQLRPDWWDTTHLELYTNPINAFLPLVLPPFLWSNDPWTGSAHGQSNPPAGP